MVRESEVRALWTKKGHPRTKPYAILKEDGRLVNAQGDVNVVFAVNAALSTDYGNGLNGYATSICVVRSQNLLTDIHSAAHSAA